MHKPDTVSPEAWQQARLALMEQEKAFTRQRDALSQARRELPWVQIGKSYEFDSPDGKKNLADLFGDCSQLIVYHFMFGPDWKEGCPSCSFWADNCQGTLPHLRARDISLALVSRASLGVLEGYIKRMGWTFNWVSSGNSDFSLDFVVSFEHKDGPPTEPNYNFARQTFKGDEAPGLSIFYRDEAGDIYYTYSCYARGQDMLNGSYHHMDLIPKGRDEAGLPHTMAWLKRRDQYGS
ncbi:MAG: putative dithiol-disulfide oxidoreductase (DUF899 family) [Halioglobus sp.]|jgi:predicted dithiol-disulfide oxidoreductase (DUF899 family)